MKSTTKRRAKAVYRLPTVAAFKQLPVAKRTLVFAKWLEQQPRDKTFNYADTQGCILATFGQALYGSSEVTAGGWAIHRIDCEYVDVFCASGRTADALSGCRTYGAASDRLQAALAK